MSVRVIPTTAHIDCGYYRAGRASYGSGSSLDDDQLHTCSTPASLYVVATPVTGRPLALRKALMTWTS